MGGTYAAQYWKILELIFCVGLSEGGPNYRWRTGPDQESRQAEQKQSGLCAVARGKDICISVSKSAQEAPESGYDAKPPLPHRGRSNRWFTCLSDSAWLINCTRSRRTYSTFSQDVGKRSRFTLPSTTTVRFRICVHEDFNSWESISVRWRHRMNLFSWKRLKFSPSC